MPATRRSSRPTETGSERSCDGSSERPASCIVGPHRNAAAGRMTSGSRGTALEIPYNAVRLQPAAPTPNPPARGVPLGEPGFPYQDLHREDRLAALDQAFLATLGRENPALAERLRAYRSDPSSVDALSRSRLLVEAARPLGAFVARLFGVDEERDRQRGAAARDAVLFRFRRDFLQRRAARAKLPEDLASVDLAAAGRAPRALERALHPALPWDADPELATSLMAVGLLDLESDFIAALRQKKKPEVSPEARERARTLAREAARAGAGLPTAADDRDESLLAFLEKALELYAAWSHLRLEHPSLRRAGRPALGPS